ncbi:MAG: FIST C-terminal domain-containing protein, partial [Phycisphaeraceae bacterium]|nr:FIST C-terminal domain-containing protein [Phycisphaeraceae bacterium]
MAQTATDLRFACAVSALERLPDALDDLADQFDQAPIAPADLALAFVTKHHLRNLPDLEQRLRHSLGAKLCLTVSADGVLGRRREIESAPGVSVLAASFPPTVTIKSFRYAQLDWLASLDKPDILRQQMALPLDGDNRPRALIVFADPFSTPMPRLLNALSDAFPNLPVLGGLASAGRSPNENRLMLDGHVTSEGAVILALSGPIDVQTVVSQGCRPIGKPLIITHAKRNVVMELGGRGALRALHDTAEQASAADRNLMQTGGLFVGRVINEYKDRFGRGDFLIRHIVGLDPDTGYIAIGDSQVRTGQTIQFHVRDQQTALEDFQLLLDAQRLHDPPAGALLVNCTDRGTSLYEQPNVDVNLAQTALGDVPLAGFFAAG